MIHRIFAISLCVILIFSFSLPVLADGTDGSATVPTAADPEVSPSDQVTLSDLNENLNVIQSLLWFFVVVLVCSIVWKFFRWFF